MLQSSSPDPVTSLLTYKTGHSGGFAHRRVTACVMQDFGINADELNAASRGSPPVALARQVAMYLCHVGFSLSFEVIGRLFGRDRTTVAHACRVVEDRRDDIWFDCRIAALELALAGNTSNEKTSNEKTSDEKTSNEAERGQ